MVCIFIGMATVGAIGYWPFFICTIRWPVAQKLVINLVVHLHILIIWLWTTFLIVLQSTRLTSMSHKHVFLAQYALAAFPAMWSNRWYFRFVLIFLGPRKILQPSPWNCMGALCHCVWCWAQCSFAATSISTLHCSVIVRMSFASSWWPWAWS